MRRLDLVCVFIASAVLPCSLNAQQSTITHFSDDTKPLLSAAAQEVAKPGTDIVVLDDEERYVIESDGRLVHTDYVALKILTQKGADEWSAVSLGWEPWHEEKPSIRARVISSDQSVHVLDPATLTDSPAKETDDNEYSDRRVVRAPLPAIAPGSVVEEEDTVRESPALAGVGILGRAFFGRSAPVRSTHFEIEAPTSVPLRYTPLLLPGLKVQRVEGNDRLRVTFDYGPLDSIDEPDLLMPPDAPAYPEVVFSTGASWSQLANAYNKIVDDKVGTSDLRSLVSKLTLAKRSRDEKIQALWQYLSTNIRYTGVEFGEASVVPRSPAEVLTRKYGDCKDKSVLLIAMLRSAGIPAYLALLEVGRREDVPSDLPGIGLFDHAIVFVPGPPDLWIDATDRYARLGELDSADQDRYALVVRPDSKALSRTPYSSAQDNTLVEHREFRLSEYGPARVVETSEPRGTLETYYRADYDNVQDKGVREQLTKYVGTLYLSDKLDAVDRSDPTDLSKQFQLVLTCNRAKRGSTDLNSAAAAIRLEAIFDRLPDNLKTREPVHDATSDSATDKPKRKRTADYELPEPFITEWHYRIIPPDGFQPKALPQNTKLTLGPATLDEQFSVDKDGVVQADIRFDIEKGRFSASEGAEMRDRIVEVESAEPILIHFEPVGEALLSSGKSREAFQSYRDLIAAHPKSAVYHLRKAQSLLSVGLGDAARQEARLAVSLEPNSALAQKTLANILEYDQVGRKFRYGSDYQGAEAAFRAAGKLDPDDKAVVGDLALLLERDKWGFRYAPDSRLDEAIAEYRRLTPEELENLGLKNGIPFALFYASHFAEAEAAAEKLNPKPTTLILACEAALNGSDAALAEARKRTATQDEFNSVVENAGQMVKNMRKYRIGAALMDAGASGTSAPFYKNLAVVYRDAKKREDIAFPDSPTTAAIRMHLLKLDPDLTVDKISALTSRNGRRFFAISAYVGDSAKGRQGYLSQQAANGLYFVDPNVDYTIADAHPIEQGNNAVGYKVVLWGSQPHKWSAYVVKEDGKYKVVGTSYQPYAVGFEVLDRVAQGDLVGARTLLDWIREDSPLKGGDDPLEGDAFPRLWTKGKDADATTMKIAAAAIAIESRFTAAQGVAALESTKPSKPDETESIGYSLALLDGYDMLMQYDKALAVSTDLLKRYPSSKRAFLRESLSLSALGRFSEAHQLAEDRLKQMPDDLDARRELAAIAARQGDHRLAHRLRLEITKSPGIVYSDFNQAAWESLFSGETSNEDLDDAVKAAQLEQNGFPALHTLGSVYAELGKVKEARDALVHAMDNADFAELEPNTWYAFGRIAEQIGETDTALADYRQVEKPDTTLTMSISSSYELAQFHLKALATATAGNKSPQSRHPVR